MLKLLKSSGEFRIKSMPAYISACFKKNLTGENQPSFSSIFSMEKTRGMKVKLV